jgi:hypothetical protein
MAARGVSSARALARHRPRRPPEAPTRLLSMVKGRTRRTIIAAIGTVLWLGYMAVGLAVIDAVAPTTGGEGPAGTAAFIGLVGGVVVVGLIMWAASDY